MDTNYSIEIITPELTWNIRHQVLYPNLPIEAAQVEDDFRGIHYGIFSNNQLRGVVSVFENEDNLLFRKLAIVAEHQNEQYGSILLNHIIVHAEKVGVKYIWCNARVSAINFYKKFGFYTTGNTFTKNGISFMSIRKDL